MAVRGPPLLRAGRYIPQFPMVRIREILDPDLRRRIVDALAARRGCSPAAIPDWFELDDADLVDLLNDLKEEEEGRDFIDDPRM